MLQFLARRLCAHFNTAFHNIAVLQRKLGSAAAEQNLENLLKALADLIEFLPESRAHSRDDLRDHLMQIGLRFFQIFFLRCQLSKPLGNPRIILNGIGIDRPKLANPAAYLLYFPAGLLKADLRAHGLCIRVCQAIFLPNLVSRRLQRQFRALQLALHLVFVVDKLCLPQLEFRVVLLPAAKFFFHDGAGLLLFLDALSALLHLLLRIFLQAFCPLGLPQQRALGRSLLFAASSLGFRSSF